jgi:hypothetical protein
VRVFQFTTHDQPLTDPKRSTFGITLALRGGDVCHPLGAEGKWFEPPYFDRFLRFWCPIPILPYLAWNLFGWRGYFGAKIYGVDSPAYKNWPGLADEVYDGSQAIHFSGRLWISD